MMNRCMMIHNDELQCMFCRGKMYLTIFSIVLHCTMSSSVSECVLNAVFSPQVARQHGMTFVAGTVLRWDRWSASRVPMFPSCLATSKVNHSPLTSCVFIYLIHLLCTLACRTGFARRKLCISADFSHVKKTFKHN